MENLAEGIALALLLAGPLAGFGVASRSGRRTRLQLIAAATLGGGVAGLMACAVTAVRAPSLDDALALWPWALSYCVVGALVGVAGVLARAFGAWLARQS